VAFTPVDINAIKMDSTPRGFSPVDVNAIQLDQPDQPNMFGRMGDIVNKGHASSEASEAARAAGQQGLLETRFQQFGNAGSGVINGLVGEAVNTALDGSPIGATNKYAIQLMMNHGGADVANAVSDAYHENTTPRQQRNLSAAANSLFLLPASPKVAEVARSATPLVADTGKQLGRTLYDAIPERPPQYDPIKGMENMGKTYAANKAQSGELYDQVNAIAKGVPVDTAGMSDHLDSLIADVQSDPMRGAYSTLPKLKSIQEKINNGTFDLADTVDLRKDLNKHFKGNQWNQNAAGTAYGDLNGKVGSIIQDASQKSGAFAQANDLAHSYWLNNLQNLNENFMVCCVLLFVEDCFLLSFVPVQYYLLYTPSITQFLCNIISILSNFITTK